MYNIIKDGDDIIALNYLNVIALVDLCYMQTVRKRICTYLFPIFSYVSYTLKVISLQSSTKIMHMHVFLTF